MGLALVAMCRQGVASAGSPECRVETVPPLIDPENLYSETRAGRLNPLAATARRRRAMAARFVSGEVLIL